MTTTEYGDAEMRALIGAVQEESRRTGWHWRYLNGCKVTHALRMDSMGLDTVAPCNVEGWSSEWLGTGSQAEYETAATLPRCRKCLQRMIEAK